MKKFWLFGLTVFFAMLAVGCGSNTEETVGLEVASTSEAVPADSTDTTASKGDFMIGIMTGTVSQTEEEYRQADRMKAKYPDNVITATYPDNFKNELETFVSRVMDLVTQGADLIVIVQAVPGTSAAIDKVHEIYPDFPFILGVSGEDPAMISEKADVIITIGEIKMGERIAEQAKAMGAKTFVHYSFPRHMSYELIVARHAIIKETCEKLGITFVDATTPDPLSDAGVTGAQQFILEDLPRKVNEYGVETAFFNTNCSMQPAMIQSILKTGAYYPQQCCPSPYHAYPEALGIKVPPEKVGDIDYILSEIKAAIAAQGGSGHFSSWPVPVNMMMIEAGVEYGFDYLSGKIDTLIDLDYWKTKFVAAADGNNVDVYNLELNGTTYDNFLQIVADYYLY